MYELSNKLGVLEPGAARKNFLKKVALVPFVFLVVGGNVMAADPVAKNEDPAIFEDLKTQLSFSSPLEAYRQGKTAFDEGWYSLALPAIEFAAKRGVFGARLTLAKMYELGLGVPVDNAAAFDLYKNISKKHWNISSYHPAAPFIGSSLTSLGLYYLNGVSESGLKPDVKKAATYFTHASQFFRNPGAQYQLGKLYLSGQGVKKNVRRAISWLNNAAKKKHAPSQALLGQLLWEGDLVPKRQIKALALLIMAQKNAGPRDSEWINELHKTIVDASDPKTRSGAKTAVARWVRIYTPRIKVKRFVIRKKVRIGIAEGGPVRTKRVVKRRPVVKEEEGDQVMGLGSFRQIGSE
ncbi:MAG: sel1 repeat family protein [bacterium]|nr:sel1 repeat family protein [bacterium]